MKVFKRSLLLIVLHVTFALSALTGKWVFTSNREAEYLLAVDGSFTSTQEVIIETPHATDTLCRKVQGTYTTPNDSIVFKIDACYTDSECDGTFDSIAHYKNEVEGLATQPIKDGRYHVVQPSENGATAVLDTFLRIED